MYKSGGDVDNERGYAYVGAGGVWEISVLSSLFCCKFKPALKKKKDFFLRAIEESLKKSSFRV